MRLFLLLLCVELVASFTILSFNAGDVRSFHTLEWPRHTAPMSGVVALSARNTKITQKRRDQLGIADDEDEYDLDAALSANTDDTINKVVAGSLILVVLGLLVVGVVVPSLTDYGEGVCNPLLTQGRC